MKYTLNEAGRKVYITQRRKKYHLNISAVVQCEQKKYENLENVT